MKFLLDMGISQKCLIWLRNQNHDCFHLRERGLLKLQDEKIVDLADHENRIILTCDNDFGAIMSLNQKVSPSIILFRLDNFSSDNICQKLSVILNEIPKNEFQKGIFITAKEQNYR